MSGPIVRRYGFPNFEKIFGKRELEHGVEEAEQGEQAAKPENQAEAESASAADQNAKEPKGRAPQS